MQAIGAPNRAQLREKIEREKEKKKRKKKSGIKALLPAEANLQPTLRICLRDCGRTFQERRSPASIQALGKEDGTGRRCPSDGASATPSLALNFSREEQCYLLS